jgi:hypothetical protein
LVYRPSRVLARVIGVAPIGSFGEVKRCRAEPVLKASGDRKAKTLEPRRVRAGFRSRRNMLAFQKPAAPDLVQICGLDPRYPAGWLELALGRVSKNALLNGIAVRVVARGAARREQTVVDTPTLERDAAKDRALEADLSAPVPAKFPHKSSLVLVMT